MVYHRSLLPLSVASLGLSLGCSVIDFYRHRDRVCTFPLLRLSLSGARASNLKTRAAPPPVNLMLLVPLVLLLLSCAPGRRWYCVASHTSAPYHCAAVRGVRRLFDLNLDTHNLPPKKHTQATPKTTPPPPALSLSLLLYTRSSALTTETLSQKS